MRLMHGKFGVCHIMGCIIQCVYSNSTTNPTSHPYYMFPLQRLHVYKGRTVADKCAIVISLSIFPFSQDCLNCVHPLTSFVITNAANVSRTIKSSARPVTLSCLPSHLLPVRDVEHLLRLRYFCMPGVIRRVWNISVAYNSCRVQ